MRLEWADVLDATHGLIDQLRDVAVVQRVHDPSAVPLADDEPDVLEQPQLMRDRGLLQADRLHQLGHRVRTFAELGQDQDAAGRRESLHRVRDPLRHLGGHPARSRATGNPWLTALQTSLA